MSVNKNEDLKVKAEKKEEQKPPLEEKKPEPKQLEIQIDGETAFALKMQEFDKNIATAEFQVADLKRQKFEFIYTRNVQLIADTYKQNEVKKQIEEETKSRLAKADIKSN